MSADRSEGVQVIDPNASAALLYMLYSVVENGTGNRAKVPGWDIAGKTGTSQLMKDAWFNSGGGGTYAKQKTMRKYRDLFKKEFDISVVITGSTRNPPKGTSKRLDDLISSDPNLAVREGKEYESRPGPFCSVDKKFLAEIYEQENLMNDLFPNTVSCTNISKIEPCKNRLLVRRKESRAFGNV